MKTKTFDKATQTPLLRFPKRVVILGNDHVAWIAATLLARNFIALQIRTTVCSGAESVPSTSKAFTSSPALTALLQNIGCDEHDLLKACAGTYRLATQFSDWAHEGRDFWQPLGSEQIRIEGHSLFDTWCSERLAGRLLRPLHSYLPHWTASLAGKAPHSFSGTSAIAASGQYGFHGDADQLAGFFRSVALQSGVEEMPSDIDRIFPNGRGGIAQVKLQSGKSVPGDLFLDCRKPADLNLQQSSGDIIDLQDQFLCDRVVHFRSPSSRKVQPFTRITAQANGWCQTIPLAQEIDHSYAFRSDFESDTDAFQTLFASVNSRAEHPLTDEPKHSFDEVAHYRRKVQWKDNVVHLGRSAIQFESLASMDLHLDLASVELLLELFPDRTIGRATRGEYISRMTSITDEFQNFLLLHHALNARSDTPYRKAAAAACLTPDVKQLLAIYDATSVVRVRNPESAPEASYRSLMAASGRLPKRASLGVRNADAGRIQQTFRDIVMHNEAIVKDLPLHEELLDWIHSGPFQQQAG